MTDFVATFGLTRFGHLLFRVVEKRVCGHFRGHLPGLWPLLRDGFGHRIREKTVKNRLKTAILGHFRGILSDF